MSGGIGQDALALKDRLNEPPLPQPEIALAGQQAVAQQQAIHAQGVMFGEIAAVQHLLDEGRMIDEEDAFQPEAQRDAIAVLAGAVQSRSRADRGASPADGR